MGRVLLYPSLAVFVLIPVVGAVWLLITVVRRRRYQRAIHAARWEPYTDPVPGGDTVEVGICLVAHIGNDRKVLRRDPKTVTVSLDDRFSTEVEAADRATRRNLLRDAHWPIP